MMLWLVESLNLVISLPSYWLVKVKNYSTFPPRLRSTHTSAVGTVFLEHSKSLPFKSPVLHVSFTTYRQSSGAMVGYPWPRHEHRTHILAPACALHTRATNAYAKSNATTTHLVPKIWWFKFRYGKIFWGTNGHPFLWCHIWPTYLTYRLVYYHNPAGIDGNYPFFINRE